MKNRFITAVVVLFVLQLGLMLLIWGSPPLKYERSLTPTPTITPPPGPPTAVPPTRIPTLIPESKGAPTRQVSGATAVVVKCPIAALDLIGAWVKGGKPRTDPFEFTSTEGKVCIGTFDRDVQPLFTTPSLWFAAAPACVSCHVANLQDAMANMSLGSYEAILAGSQRSDPAKPGNDILGDAATWEKSKLYEMISTLKMPLGRPADAPPKGPVVRAGEVK